MYKDTAKWLLTFAPISAAVTFALTIGPRIRTINGAGLAEVARNHCVAITALSLLMVAIIAVVVWCCRVLLASPSTWKELRSSAREDWFSDAFSKHAVGIPLFRSSTAFKDAEIRALEGKASPAEHAALAQTASRILELSESDNARQRFRQFLCCYGICVVVILAGMVIAPLTMPAVPDAVTRPTPVSLVMPTEAEKHFTELTGCTSVQDTTAIAVAGLWTQPRLRLIGQGCTPEEWTAPDGLGIIATPQ